MKLQRYSACSIKDVFILEFNRKKPFLHREVFVAPGCHIIGEVSIDKASSVWFGTVIRGDVNSITIGKKTNIQDNCTLHVGDFNKIEIGDRVTIGHNAIIHGCTIKDNVLIGMGAIVLNGAVIGKNSIIGAGALVPENRVIPEGVLVVGVPCKVIRALTDEEIKRIGKSADNYVDLAKKYNNI